MKTNEQTAIQGLALSGLSIAEIARNTGRSREAVRKCLSSEEFQRAREIARSALAENVASFADDWKRASRESAKRGRHEPARDALIALKAIDSPNQKPETSNSFKIQIGVALPGLGQPTTEGPISVSLPPAPNDSETEPSGE
jgi:IS30 family transposase